MSRSPELLSKGVPERSTARCACWQASRSPIPKYEKPLRKSCTSSMTTMSHGSAPPDHTSSPHRRRFGRFAMAEVVVVGVVVVGVVVYRRR